MTTQVFCVTTDVPDAWAKQMQVGDTLGATLAEHLDAARNGNAVAPWDLQEVKDAMGPHGHEREPAAPGGGPPEGLPPHFQRAPTAPASLNPPAWSTPLQVAAPTPDPLALAATALAAAVERRRDGGGWLPPIQVAGVAAGAGAARAGATLTTRPITHPQATPT